jgi:hypothetical protein
MKSLNLVLPPGTALGKQAGFRGYCLLLRSKNRFSQANIVIGKTFLQKCADALGKTINPLLYAPHRRFIP